MGFMIYKYNRFKLLNNNVMSMLKRLETIKMRNHI